MMSDTRFFLVVASWAIAAVVFSFGVSNEYGKYTCSNFAEITQKPTRWATLDACYIKTDKGWQRWDEYKMRQAAFDGLTEDKQ